MIRYVALIGLKRLGGFLIEAGHDGEFKASEDTEEGQYEHGVERVGGVNGVVASVEGGNGFG